MVLNLQVTEPLRQCVENLQVQDQPLPRGQLQVGAEPHLLNHPEPSKL